MNQRQLALRVGIDPRHFNSLWHDKKAAGLPLIRKIGQRAGRSIAWLCGEEAARPLIGTANALGQVTMTTDNTPISQGIIHFIDGAGAFAPGERVLVDPSDRWAEGHWLRTAGPRGIGSLCVHVQAARRGWDGRGCGVTCSCSSEPMAR